MARGRPPTTNVPDSVRDAVEKTIQATLASAQTTRGRAADAVDDIVRGAEASAETVRDRVRGAIEERRPATSDEIRDLHKELRALARRLDAVEAQLSQTGGAKPKPKPTTKAAASGTRKKSTGGSSRSGRSAPKSSKS